MSRNCSWSFNVNQILQDVQLLLKKVVISNLDTHLFLIPLLIVFIGGRGVIHTAVLRLILNPSDHQFLRYGEIEKTEIRSI